MCSSDSSVPRRLTTSLLRISSGSVSTHESSGPWPMAPRTVSQLDDELRAGHRLRSAAALLVRLAELHALELDAGDLVLLVGHDPGRRGLEDDPRALLDRLVHLVLGGHVLEVAAVDQRHLRSALADARPGAVDGGEAATDDDDPGPLQAGHLDTPGRVVEVLERVHHPVRVLAGDAELVRLVAADSDIDRVVALLEEVRHVEVAAEAHVRLQRGAQLPDVVELAVHPCLREAVLGDPVAQHAALLRLGLEHVAVVAAQLEVVRDAHAGRAGTDDGHAAPGVGLLGPRDRCGRVDLEHAVRAVSMRVADRDGGVDLLAPAVRLAWRGADAAEDGREGKRALEDARRLLPVAQRVLLQVAGDVDPGGALELAGRQAVGVVVAEDELEDHAPVLDEPVGVGGDDHSRLDLWCRRRSACRPDPRPRRRRSGTPRTAPASARSRASGRRCRARDRPGGSSVPPPPGPRCR